jgi:hypothetical protein
VQNCDRSRDAYIIHSRKITACVNRKYFAECSKTTINSKPIQGYEWTSVKNKVPSEIMVYSGTGAHAGVDDVSCGFCQETLNCQ